MEQVSVEKVGATNHVNQRANINRQYENLHKSAAASLADDDSCPPTRRQLLKRALGAVTTMILAPQVAALSEVRRPGAEHPQEKPLDQDAIQGRLRARPQPVKENAPVGLQPLLLDGKEGGVVYVPAKYKADRPAPLVLLLHGAGGNGKRILNFLPQFAGEAGLILLAPNSRGKTWDIVSGHYGPDVAFIDRALELVFSRYSVDQTHIGVCGFSDGASYALSLGLMNGDLFTHVMAFSPGFLALTQRLGSPRLLITHGIEDSVLPIERSRQLVPKLKSAGYETRYREFIGSHTVLPFMAREAVEWFTKGITP